MRIMLVRHGITTWNNEKKMQGSSDVELAPEGIHQAELLAENCPFEKVDAIYSSPLRRAFVTAKILADKFNLPVVNVPELSETNFGVWEGQYLSDIAKNDPINFEKFFTAPDDVKVEGFETFSDAQKRAVVGIKKIIAAHRDDEQIIVAAHGAINRLIIGSILDIPINNLWRLDQYNTCVNILRVDGENITVSLINSVVHLEKLESLW